MRRCCDGKRAISIHAPREGSDSLQNSVLQWGKFQSTLPVRGATRSVSPRVRSDFISIHAPREGSDATINQLRLAFQIQFQSTLPVRGATFVFLVSISHKIIFQSTLPVRGATNGPRCRPASKRISIHAPREGSDLYGVGAVGFRFISIHAPREGSD